MSTGPSRSGSPIRQQLDDLDALLERILDLPGRRDGGTNGEEAPDRPEPPPPPAPPTVPSPYMVGRPAEPLHPPATGGASSRSDPPTAPAEDEQWVPLRPQGWQPSAHTWGPLAESWRKGQVEDLPPEGAGPPREEPERVPPVSPPSLEAKLRFEEEPPARPEAAEWPPPDPPPDLPGAGVAEEGFASWSPPPLPSPAPAEPEPEERPISLPAPAPEEPGEPEAVPAWLGPLVWLNRGFEAGARALGPPGRWLASPSGRTALGTAGLFALAVALLVLLLHGIGWTG